MDLHVSDKYGAVVAVLWDRRLLSRCQAKTFVVITFTRRYLLCFFILYFAETPVLQITLTYILQLAYTVYIFKNSVFREGAKDEKRNEVVILVVLICLMCFV